ncbi:hypothetical protein BGW37DRAFT_262750 [Umbelopsis sp. PMI_123]|nr:hypothetical protein BGW37DRAFT_262750 [Umbelopsis sp. PMI_123]
MILSFQSLFLFFGSPIGTMTTTLMSFTAFTPQPTVNAIASPMADSSLRLTLIMAVMVASICFFGFFWQCIQCYIHFRKLNWSQVIVILVSECVLGWIFSALSLAEYLCSISCEFRAVAELIAINTGDFLFQALLLHRVYAIKRSKRLLIAGITLITSLLIYIMISLAAGQLVATAVDASVCATQSRMYH